MTRLDAIREAPHSIDAEQAVLGGLMLDARALAKIDDWLNEEDFYRKDHRLIFRAIKSLSDKGQPCDAVTLGEWFEENALAELLGGMGYLLNIANTTPSAANIVAYAEIVREKSILRTLIDTGTSLTSSAFDAKPSTDLIAGAMHSLQGLSAASARGGLIHVKQPIRQVFAAMHERYTNKAPLIGLPTPWAGLNALTKGLRKRTVYIVGGRPSMGKSIIGENIATFTGLRGKRVAYFSPEMAAEEVMSRACAAHGDIPFDWIDQPDDDEVNWSRMTRIMQSLVESNLYIDDTPAISIRQLSARIRREHQRKPFDLLVTDHMHDMLIENKDRARFEIGEIVQGFKTLAKELDIPAVVLAQLNRSVTSRSDRRPTLADLRESGEIEQKGDVIIFVHREDYYDPQTNLRDVVELIPAKGRNLKLGSTIYLRNRFDRMRCDDLDGPPPEPEQASKSSRRGSGLRRSQEPAL